MFCMNFVYVRISLILAEIQSCIFLILKNSDKLFCEWRKKRQISSLCWLNENIFNLDKIIRIEHNANMGIIFCNLKLQLGFWHLNVAHFVFLVRKKRVWGLSGFKWRQVIWSTRIIYWNTFLPLINNFVVAITRLSFSSEKYSFLISNIKIKIGKWKRPFILQKIQEDLVKRFIDKSGT